MTNSESLHEKANSSNHEVTRYVEGNILYNLRNRRQLSVVVSLVKDRFTKVSISIFTGQLNPEMFFHF